jgi:hypothetical protein
MKAKLPERISVMSRKGLSISKILEELQLEGYLFHGSNEKYPTLEPRRTDCKGIPMPIKRVSASPDSSYAMFFAITPKGVEGRKTVVFCEKELKFGATKRILDNLNWMCSCGKGAKVRGAFQEIFHT